MNKDKEYIVDSETNTQLTPEEQKNLRKKSKPVGTSLSYNRQDVLQDRRDPFAKKKPGQTERRKNKYDRRDSGE